MRLPLLAVIFFASHVFAGDNLWIDVRGSDEYQQSHVEQAINITHTSIGDKIASVAPDKFKTIYVYCRSGRRSGMAKEALEELGYKNVINLGGLMDARSFAQRNPEQ